MSKFTKLIKDPKRFFYDAWKKDFESKQIPKKAPKSLKEYTDPIKVFKANYPVNSIQYKQHKIWPLLRNELLVQSTFAWRKQIQNLTHFNPRLSQMMHESNIDYSMIQEYKAVYQFLELADIQEEQTDFLFFSSINSVDQVKIEEKIYNRLIDPIYEAALKIGSAKKIELIKGISNGVDKTSNYRYKAECILPPYIYKEGFYQEIQYDKKFFTLFKKYVPYMHMDEEHLKTFFNWQFHLVDFFTELLKKYTPKVIFIFPYYYHTPLIYAANILGIKTVEIQHGIMAGENDFYYDNWQEIPKEGYNTLPQYLWLWGEYEYNRLSKKVFKQKNSPKLIQGGYPWLDYVKNLDNSKLERLKSSFSSFEYTYVSLVTLQSKNKLPLHMIKLIESTESKVLWLIRKHPKGLNFDMSTVKSSNILINDDINSIIITKLFSLVDTHFTESSTSLLEADYSGIYSYIYDKSGYKNYKKYIDTNDVGYYTENDMEKHFPTIKEVPISHETLPLEGFIKYGTRNHKYTDTKEVKSNNIDNNSEKILDYFFNKDTITKKRRLDYITKANTESILNSLLKNNNV